MSISRILTTCLILARSLAPGAEARGAQDTAPAFRDTPEAFVPVHDSFDYTRREVMIPMRDGTRLFTILLIPRGATRAPMLLTRTPYDATTMSANASTNRLASNLHGYDNFEGLHTRGGYIRVLQDVRGKYRSEGDYVMNRPIAGPLNPTGIDHATDAWDTIDWLVRNVPESNGKVGIMGISYDGFTSLMALADPHPALKVAVPMNPMVNGWIGDDWFHNGAYRQVSLPYIYEQVNSRDNSVRWWSTHEDQYSFFLDHGSAGAVGKAYGLEQNGFFRKLTQHPAYDDFWQGQALESVLADRQDRVSVPTLLVHGLWDQEDIYGALAVYEALKDKPGARQNLHLVLGPWNHGGQREDGSSLGPIRFGSDTALHFREQILKPFLDQYLMDDAPEADLARVTAFRTGENRWERLPDWPGRHEAPEPVSHRALYLTPGKGLSFGRPERASGVQYIADPATPVPFLPRPIAAAGYADNPWLHWLVTDQRSASSRPDVLTFVSPPLDAPLRLRGTPKVHITIRTSGSDGDFVVKLIDTYPDLVPGRPKMGGYELMIASDILRARYRDDPARPEALPSGKDVPLSFDLPAVNHTFRPGHRLMVQVQSSWFPLYDRNPQTFVPNIFHARPEDFTRATIEVRLGGARASAIELPIATD